MFYLRLKFYKPKETMENFNSCCATWVQKSKKKRIIGLFEIKKTHETDSYSRKKIRGFWKTKWN